MKHNQEVQASSNDGRAQEKLTSIVTSTLRDSVIYMNYLYLTGHMFKPL